MADNAVVNGVTVASDDRSGVYYQRVIVAGSTAVTVGTGSVTTSAAQIIGANAARQNVLLVNTSSAQWEISPVSGFAVGAGIPVAAGQSFETRYQGILYGRISTGTGSYRYWDEYDS